MLILPADSVCTNHGAYTFIWKPICTVCMYRCASGWSASEILAIAPVDPQSPLERTPSMAAMYRSCICCRFSVQCIHSTFGM